MPERPESGEARGHARAGRARSTTAGSVRTLERGLGVLTALADLREATLGEVARQVGLPASTTSRLLDTLRQGGFAEWDERQGLYTVGLRAYQVGAAFAARNTLIGAAQTEMDALVAALGETVNLAALRGPAGQEEAVYIHQAEGRGLVRLFAQLGAAAPLHCSGVGKVLLASLPPQEARARIALAELKAYTPHTLTTAEALGTELARVAAHGYALDDEEREVGVRCLAVPVRGASGAVVAALSVSAPSARFTPADVPRVAAEVQASAARVSARLGWNGGR
ncbi:IclR family transcriptional regulator [Deinococcus sp. Leaf326]|uniref:IclR family transcriptional regulator n=1 Tax=Deinococcus sp. Leaf326 TaxID=1736338 RepID=UPI0009E9D7D2|nr:IclR family transcriptional regulator [Deinococcus sp. Leaf326]